MCIEEKNAYVKKPKLTRGTKALIKKAIEETGSHNREVLCFAITQMIEKKFPGLTLEYQSNRMQLATTKPILEAIDDYFLRYFPQSN